MTKIPGEKNELWYIPLGAGLAVPRGIFALAILRRYIRCCRDGQYVVLSRPAILRHRWMFFNLMREVGLPAGVINL